VLVPEPTNPHDPNAIAVHIDGDLVGYLPRGVAQEYLPGLLHLMSRLGGYIALRGVIVGGGYYADGPGRLGVWLEHDPADFGIAPLHLSRSQLPGSVNPDGVMRTGFSEAWLTDAEDDSYDLSWFNQLPEADRPAIAMLRELLATDPDPIDRHFQFCELETRLYRSRELYESALAEYDQACALHDAEMQQICAAFMAKWAKIPLLDTYRQMAVRQQKKKDWQACRWWAERGLALYGDHAAREEAVEDLIKRRNRAAAKLETTAEPTRHVRPDPTAITAQRQSRSNPANLHPASELEVLTCQQCGSSFERMRVRGRKPTLCPACRATAPE
jgi:HIRAN domain-containing protein/FPG/IleRS zinc finger protein